MNRLRYTVPNGFTSLSLLLGIASIVTSQIGELELAAWIIVWCGLLDVLDGLSARLLKATSDFGAEFDSMAVVSVITALEDQLGILVEDDDITGETFETLGNLTAFVQSKL